MMTKLSRTSILLILAATFLCAAGQPQPSAWAQQSAAPVAPAPMLPPGSPGDFTADMVLGQGNFLQNQRNFIDGRGFNLQFSNGDIAIDRTATPNHVYVADTANNRILAWKDVAKFNTHQPADVAFGQPNLFSSSCNGGIFYPSATTLCFPAGVAVDSAHRLYVADTSNNRVLEFDNPFGTATPDTVADDVFGQFGLFTSNQCNGSSNFQTNAATLCVPIGVAVDSADNLYVADSNNNRVLGYRTPEKVTAVIGSGDELADKVFGQLDNFGASSCNNGGVTASSLCSPLGVGADGVNLFIADSSNNRVLEYNNPLSAAGNTTADRVFGQGNIFTTSGCNVPSLSANSLCGPARVTADAAHNVYIADNGNNRALEYNTPLAAGGNRTADRVFGQTVFTTSSCNAGSTPNAARLCSPNGVALDTAGDFYVLDGDNNRVLEYKTPLTTNTVADAVAGQLLFTTNFSNQLDPRGFDFGFGTSGIAIDKSANPPRLYVADNNNNRVLGFSSVAVFASHGSASLVFGQPNLSANLCNNGGTSELSLCIPRGVAVDGAGNLYVADTSNSRVLEYDKPFGVGGDTKADRVFGQSGSFSLGFCNNGGVSANSLCFPQGVAVDASGRLYVADSSNNRVLEYNTPLGVGVPTANKVFGQLNNFLVSSCNNGGVSAKSLCFPTGAALDGSNNLYVADNSNNRVLEYNTPLTTDTTADRVFGQGGSFASPLCNSGGRSAGSLCSPRSMAVDSLKNVYISDNGNSRVLKYKTPLTTDTFADQVFGQSGQFTQGFCRTTSVESLCNPDGVAVDVNKNLYVGDTFNNRVVEYLAP